MSKRIAIDPANLCVECGHLVYGLSSGCDFCPCEDCHVGGLIQGRKPRSGSQLTVTPSVTDKVSDLEEVGHDPLHSLGEDNLIPFEDLSDDDKRWAAEGWLEGEQG